MVLVKQGFVDIYKHLYSLYYTRNFGVNMSEITWDAVLFIVPCIVLGLLVGIANYFKEFAHDEPIKPSFRRFLGTFFSGGVIGFISFTLLHEFTGMSYLAKLGLATAVTFFGVDKVLEIAQKILHLRGGGK